MSKSNLVALVALFALLTVGAALAEDVIPLSVTEPAGLDRDNVPVVGGVPVGPLRVRDVKDLVLVDDAGHALPAQFSPMVTRENGEIVWVLVDTLSDLPAGQTRKLGLRVRDNNLVAPGVRNRVELSQNDDAIELSNGLMRLVLSKKKFNLFEQVWLDRNGDGKFGDAEKMLADEQPPALAVLRGLYPTADGNALGQALTTRDGKVTAVTLEDAGSVRTTVRIDGQFAAAPGGRNETSAPTAKGSACLDHPLRWTVRVTMWAGRTDIRVLYALRNVNHQLQSQEKIRNATMTVKLAPLAGVKHYLVGAGDVHFSQLSAGEKDALKSSQWHSKVRLSQVGPPEAVTSRTHRQFYALRDFEDAGYRVEQFQPGNRSPFVDVGFACRGWLDLAGDAGGCQLTLRDFTRDTPKQLIAQADGTLSAELIPVYDGDRQPYYAEGGYWLGDRSYRTYEANFHFHDKPLTAKADWDKYAREFSCYVAPTAETAAAADAIASRALRPLQLVTTPKWLSDTDALWGPVLSQEDENAAAAAMGRTSAGPIRPQTASALANDFLHYENFHYRSESDEVRDAVLEYIRTGDEQFYRRAHSFGRNYRDLGVARIDGKPMADRPANNGPQKYGAIPRWGKFCDCHNYGAGLIDLWLISGDRSYLDAGLDHAYDLASQPRPYGGFGSRHWGRRMIAILRAYMVTGDATLRDYLVAKCRPVVPDEATRADGRGLICGKHQSSWMTALCSHAIWHNYKVNGHLLNELERDDYEDGIIALARMTAKYWYFPQYKSGPYWLDFDKPAPGDVTANGGGDPYSLTCIDMMTRGYLLTGDRKLLDQATFFWNLVNGDDAAVQSLRLRDFQGMGSADFWARQLINEHAHPRTDRQGPQRIADLAAQPLGGGKVKLTWTAVPDRDGGMLARYQVKHAPCPIVTFEAFDYKRDLNKKWTWWSAYNVAGEPRPAPPKAAESMIVEGIPAGTRYFAIVGKDDSSNESELSNVVAVEVK